MFRYFIENLVQCNPVFMVFAESSFSYVNCLISERSPAGGVLGASAYAELGPRTGAQAKALPRESRAYEGPARTAYAPRPGQGTTPVGGGTSGWVCNTHAPSPSGGVIDSLSPNPL